MYLPIHHDNYGSSCSVGVPSPVLVSPSGPPTLYVPAVSPSWVGTVPPVQDSSRYRFLSVLRGKPPGTGPDRDNHL